MVQQIVFRKLLVKKYCQLFLKEITCQIPSKAKVLHKIDNWIEKYVGNLARFHRLASLMLVKQLLQGMMFWHTQKLALFWILLGSFKTEPIYLVVSFGNNWVHETLEFRKEIGNLLACPFWTWNGMRYALRSRLRIQCT